MKKIYAEPMTKVMRLNVANIMDPDPQMPGSTVKDDDQPKDGELSLF